MRQFNNAAASISASIYYYFLKFLLASAFVINIAGCLGSPKQQSFGSAKLSPDGSVLAVMEFDKEGAQLKIKNVNQLHDDWQKIKIPISAGSFNFSQSGRSILITHREEKHGILSKIELDGDYKITELYHSELGLAFPNEISSDQYLIQAVTRITKNGYSMHQWRVVASHNSVTNIGEEFGPPYSNVSLVKNSGFFIVTDADGTEKIRLFSLPNGSLPDIDKYISQETHNLVCDLEVLNCIKKDRYSDKDGYYFRVFRISKNEQCELKGFPRWIRSISISPNGKHALIVASTDYKTKPVLETLSLSISDCANFTKITLEY